MAINNTAHPTFVRLRIKQSKTDPFRKGVGRTGSDLCPVAALMSYLQGRGSAPGPLLRFASGSPLTRRRFVEVVCAALAGTDVDQRNCRHSFCIGAATIVAAKSIEDSATKTSGRWEFTYNMYVS